MERFWVPWAEALQVRLQNGLERRFDNAHDAADFLENEWPVKHGEKYEFALRTCRDAPRQKACFDIARDAFMAACCEAKLEIVKRATRH
jgi:hypothetical protein